MSCFMLFYADVVLGGGGSYLWQLFGDAILKSLLLSKFIFLGKKINK